VRIGVQNGTNCNTMIVATVMACRKTALQHTNDRRAVQSSREMENGMKLVPATTTVRPSNKLDQSEPRV